MFNFQVIKPDDFIVHGWSGGVTSEIFLYPEGSDYKKKNFQVRISSAQIKAMKQVSSSLKLELAQYTEMQAFAQFGSDLDAATKATLEHGQRVREVLKQAQYSPRSVAKQVVTLFALKYGYTKQIAVTKVNMFMDELYQFIQNQHPEIIDQIQQEKSIDDELTLKMKEVMKAFVENFLKVNKDG